MGQGITPAGYHNIADAMTNEQLSHFLSEIQETVKSIVDGLPQHGDFVNS